MTNPDPDMLTKTELTDWASRHGMVVVDKAEHDTLCAEAAALFAIRDLDDDLAALLGHGKG